MPKSPKNDMAVLSGLQDADAARRGLRLLVLHRMAEQGAEFDLREQQPRDL
jgi:hypothetical protein